MKKFVLVILSALAFSASAEQSENVFQCMDKATLEFDASCVANDMELKFDFSTQQQQKFDQEISLSGMAMATMTYYPQQHTIEIKASSTIEPELVAANNL